MKKIISTITIVFLFCINAHADTSVPPLINYQGMLTDADGKPMIGTKNLEFNIYDSATGGTKIWGPQIFNTVPLINGKFNVILGTTDNDGNSIIEAFGAKDRYLGIKVDNGAELAPRQQILSAPYAIKAEHAAQANNADTADHAKLADVSETVQGINLYVNSENSRVGIGTETPEAKLDVNGDLKVRGGLESDCRICIGYADNNGDSPENEVCVPMQPNSESPHLQLTGAKMNGDDRLWLFYRCP